ncbi:MAG: cytochrome c biogenesis protein CcdA [Chloroflexota bacterium]|nr:cytochrome c biogenesis protein CcdA [Chloroflexota bacterium]
MAPGENVTIALAFLAGLISFASPCVLALMPVYLAFLGESAGAAASVGSGGLVTSAASIAAGERPTSAVTRPVLGQALLFVLGFSSVFVLLGTPVGLLGTALFTFDAVRRVAGVAVIGLGLLTTGIFGPVLQRWTPRVPGTDVLPPGRVARALALGALVAIGWTPCIGPVLGAILNVSASTQNALVAVLLLIGYSAGLAVPFLAAAVALPRMRPLLITLRRHHRLVEVVAGVFIMAMGVLIFSNAFARMSSLFSFFL